jgi:hypothetical protein
MKVQILLREQLPWKQSGSNMVQIGRNHLGADLRVALAGTCASPFAGERTAVLVRPRMQRVGIRYGLIGYS